MGVDEKYIQKGDWKKEEERKEEGKRGSKRELGRVMQ